MDIVNINSQFGLSVSSVFKPSECNLKETLKHNTSKERLPHLNVSGLHTTASGLERSNNRLDRSNENICDPFDRLTCLQKQHNLFETIPATSDKLRKSLSSNLFKNACKGLSFEKDVVNERTSRVVQLFGGKNNLVEVKKSKKKIIKSLLRPKDSVSPAPFVLADPVLTDKKPSCESLATEYTKALSSNQSQLTLSDELIQKEPDHTWNEYVLTLLSKSTADLIVRDFSTQEQSEKFQTWLKEYEEKKENKFEEKLQDMEEPKLECTLPIASDSTTYFSAIPAKKCNKPKKKKKKKKDVVVQETLPTHPHKWSKEEKKEEYKTIKKNCNAKKNMGKKEKGIKKWLKYVEKEESSSSMLRPEDSRLTPIEDQEAISKAQRRSLSLSNSLLRAVGEWQSKWLLEKEWQKKDVDDLFQAMGSINDHVRLAAVAAVGKVILEKRLESEEKKSISIFSEEHVVEKLQKSLFDKCLHVSIAAAVTLFVIDRATQKASDLLMESVQNGAPSERWVAVQCLAENDHYEDCIIGELLSHLNEKDTFKANKSKVLLIHLSNFTITVQYMLAEQLNSTNWKDRLVACKTLPNLHGILSRDIANKLSYLMWNDWNTEVRMTAVQALGKSGNGKIVHESLCKHLRGTDTKRIIESLRILSSIAIISEHLFGAVLHCLESEDDAVCLQAILAVSMLKLNSSAVHKKLVEIASSYRHVAIKAAALRVLGFVGNDSQAIRDCLLWALHFEHDTDVRLQACTSIAKLGLHDEEIVNVLQELVVIETNETLKNQIALVLHSMGLEPTGDLTMLNSIRQNVKNLCNKKNVLARILIVSQEEFKKFLLQQENMSIEKSDVSDLVISERSFDATLEAYRIRQEDTGERNIPEVTDSFIPFWNDSNDSFFG